MDRDQRPLFWIGSSKKDLKALPDDVQQVFGYALHLTQEGGKHLQAKPLKGFTGAKVFQIAEDHPNETHRVVYAVVPNRSVYVLHCFRKKSTNGIATRKTDIALIHKRLKIALKHKGG
jgi:phage-related protein